jgi:hypothetical protein
MTMSETTATQMTVEQVNAAFADMELKFTGYFKYSFSFVGTAPNGETIVASMGGNPDDIYRLEIEPNKLVRFNKCEDWSFVQVLDFNGGKAFVWFSD